MSEYELQKMRDKFYNNFIKIDLSKNVIKKEKNVKMIINAKPVIQYDLQHNFIKRYASAIQAAEEIKISNVTISQCLTGRNKTAGGYLWEYDK